METKKGYKLQEFVAHAGNVNCLSFGKKNCRVFITGGDDQKVNLWSVGKPTSLMSLCGHTSPVESASFDSSEVLVIAGSSSGAIKLWDLEETKLVRTLTGHRSYCTAVEFHPFGEFFASGSMDTNLKIWDIRKKGCIHTYKGHTRGISTIRFSPDGRWVVSGGFDNVVKVWDLTAGKLLHDFKFHEGHVRAIEFHPLEFLLATGSADKTVKFWDLETFEMIGSGRRESSGVRSITFHPDGRSLFCGFDDSLKVYSWEPVICHDSVDMGWSTLGDLCVHDGKLLGGAYYENSVAIWVADISLMDRNGSRLATEQLGQREQKSANQGSLLEKEESQEKSKPNPRPATPESDSKDIKTIYVDTAGVNSSTSKTVDPVDAPKVVLRRSNSITSKTIDPLDAPKVAHSSDSKVMSTAGTQKRAPTVKNVSSSNRSLVMPSIVPRDGPTGRDTAGSRRNSLAPATRTSVAMSAKSQARRLSDNRFDMGRLSVSLESVPSENLKSSVARTKDANFHSRVVADENTKESSREKQSSIKTVVEKTDRTPLPATASSTEGDQSLSSSKEAKPVRVVNGVSVVHGRTRSLVERFERRETPDVTETETLVGASDAAAESTVSRVIGEPVVSHVIAEPVESHVNAEPVASRTTASPATSRVSAEPVGSRMTTSPVTSRVSAEPVSSRMTTSPATSRATADPPASRATAVPVASRSTAVPVASRATAVPVASRRTVEPLPFRLTDEPVVSRTTAQPVRSCLTAQPMQITSSKKGDQQVMNEEPPSGDNNVIEILMQNHDMLLSTYKSRLTKLQVVRHFWERNDVKGTINAVKKLPDRSVQADVAGVLIDRVEIITLDLFSCLLPVLIGLLESTAERHATVSLEMLLKLVAVFGTVVRSTVSAPPAVGVDLHLEERRACCRQCFAHLQNVQKFLPELVKRGGVVARCAQQLNMVLQQVLL